MIERILMGAVVAVCLIGLYVTAPDQPEVERQAEQYCEMVEIWDQTDGDAGWPPYKGREGCER